MLKWPLYRFTSKPALLAGMIAITLSACISQPAPEADPGTPGFVNGNPIADGIVFRVIQHGNVVEAWRRSSAAGRSMVQIRAAYIEAIRMKTGCDVLWIQADRLSSAALVDCRPPSEWPACRHNVDIPRTECDDPAMLEAQQIAQYHALKREIRWNEIRARARESQND